MLLLLLGKTICQDNIRVSCAPEGAVTTSECKVPTSEAISFEIPKVMVVIAWIMSL